MPKLIQDEFTMQNISAQRKWQLRRERDGLCRLCGQPATGPYCPTHLTAQHRAVKRWSATERDPQSVI